MTHFIPFAVDLARTTKVGKCDQYASITVPWDGVKAIANL
jgi:hypothetical protein